MAQLNTLVSKYLFRGSQLYVCAHTCTCMFFRLLKHPNIVTLLGYATAANEIVIIMNYIRGKNLDELIFGKEGVVRKVSSLCLKTNEWR